MVIIYYNFCGKINQITNDSVCWRGHRYDRQRDSKHRWGELGGFTSLQGYAVIGKTSNGCVQLYGKIITPNLEGYAYNITTKGSKICMRKFMIVDIHCTHSCNCVCLSSCVAEWMAKCYKVVTRAICSDEKCFRSSYISVSLPFTYALSYVFTSYVIFTYELIMLTIVSS